MRFSVGELHRRIDGEVFDAPDALEYFSTDGSVFKVMPQAVVYPRNTKDVQEIVKYAAELEKDGHKVALTPRGKGTDQGGGALGDGLQMVFPAHMNKILKLGKDTVVVQPGVPYKTLQDVLHLHGRFLPPYPSSIDFCTIGGAVANNACGEKTVKYGATRDFVEKLKVVLSDGSVIETKRLTARELNRKKGLMTLEGAIYRAVDSQVEENHDLIEDTRPHVSKNASGYAYWAVKGKDGSFDLGQLIVGSQGTLGIVTEITLRTAPFNPKTALVVMECGSLHEATKIIDRVMPLKPSALEVVDYYLLEFLKDNKPQQIEGLIDEPLPKIVLLAEFDDRSQVSQNLKARKVVRIAKKLGAKVRLSFDPDEQQKLWAIRRSAAAVIWMTKGKKKALPIIEDGVVPLAKLETYLENTYKILKKHKLQIAVWGHAGNANFHMQPFMDLGEKGIADKIYSVIDDYYSNIIKLGGSTSGEHNDGLLRAPYLEKLYGTQMYGLFRRLNLVFDPQSIMNPMVKLQVTPEKTRPLLRKEYSMKHLYDHMPHT